MQSFKKSVAPCTFAGAHSDLNQDSYVVFTDSEAVLCSRSAPILSAEAKYRYVSRYSRRRRIDNSLLPIISNRPRNATRTLRSNSVDRCPSEPIMFLPEGPFVERLPALLGHYFYPTRINRPTKSLQRGTPVRTSSATSLRRSTCRPL